jgi:hypothetical protein
LGFKGSLPFNGVSFYAGLSTTGYSPYYLLHVREITPATENLKAKIPRTTQPLEQQLENLKTCLKMAYKTVAAANMEAHRTNKNLFPHL